MSLEIIWFTIFGVLGIICLAILIKILFNFIYWFRKDYLIYKFNLKSVFKNKLSLIVILFFYFVSFGLIGGMELSNAKFSRELNNNIKNQHLWQGNIPSLTFKLETINEDIKPSVGTTWQDTTGGEAIIAYVTEFQTSFPSVTSEDWINYFGTVNDRENTEYAIATLILFNNFVKNGLSAEEITNFSYAYQLIYPFQPLTTDPSISYTFISYSYFLDTSSYPVVIQELLENDSLYRINEPNMQLTWTGYSETEFISPHAGTTDDPYQLIVSQDFYSSNGNFRLGETYLIDGAYYQMVGTYYAPEQTYQIPPLETSPIPNPFPDKSSQALFLINMEDLFKITYGKADKSFEIFFGFNDVYDKTKNYLQWTTIGARDGSLIATPYTNFLQEFNQYYFSSEEFNLPATSNPYFRYYSLQSITSILDSNNMTDLRANSIFYNAYFNIQLTRFITIVFLFVVIIVLILVLRKKIVDFNVQIGTLKALGYSDSRICTAFLLIPITIIFLGFLLSLIAIWPMSLLFLSIFGRYYFINLSGFFLTFNLIFLIFLLPLVIAIVFTYLIIKVKIHTPALKLLANEGKNKPNIATKGASKLLPPQTSFSFSYKYKGFFRQSSKSVLLVFAILVSIFLTSFAFAASTMVSKTVDDVFNTLDYEVKNYENESPVTNYIDGSEASFEKPEAINFEPNWTPIVIDILDGTITTYDQLADAVWEFHTAFANLPLTESLFVVTKATGNTPPEIASNYYLPSSTMVNLSLFYFITEEKYGDTSLDISGYDYVLNDFNTLFSLYLRSILQNIYLTYPSESYSQLLELNFNEMTLREMLVFIQSFEPEVIENIFAEVYFNDLVYYSQTESGQGYQSIARATDIYFPSKGFNANTVTELEEANTENYLSSYWFQYGDDVSNKANFEAYPDINELSETINFTDDQLNELNNYQQTAQNYYSIPIITSNYQVKNYSTGERVLKNLQDQGHFPNFYYEIDLNDNIYPVINSSYVYDSANNEYTRSFYLTTVEVVAQYDISISLGTFSLSNFVETNYTQIQNYETAESQTYIYEYDALRDSLEPVGVNDLNISNENLVFTIETGAIENRPPPNLTLELPTGLISETYDPGPGATYEINFAEFIDYSLETNGFTSTQRFSLKLVDIVELSRQAYDIVNSFLIAVSFFAMFLGITIIIIAIKDIVDNSRREISMLKAFGYSNWKSTSLVMTPYLLIISLSFIISTMVVIFGLQIMNVRLTALTGLIFSLQLTLIQWFFVFGFVAIVIFIILLITYFVFSYVNPIDTIKETNE